MDRAHSPPLHYPHSHEHHPRGHNPRHGRWHDSEKSHHAAPAPPHPHHPRDPHRWGGFPPPTGPAWTPWHPPGGGPNRQDGHAPLPLDPLNGPTHPPHPPHPYMNGAPPPPHPGGPPHTAAWARRPRGREEHPVSSSTGDGEGYGRRQGFQSYPSPGLAVHLAAMQEAGGRGSGGLDRGASVGDGTPESSEEGGEKRMRMDGEEVVLPKRGRHREAERRAALEQVTAELAKPHALGLATRGERDVEQVKAEAGNDANTMEEEEEEEEEEAVDNGGTGSGRSFAPQCNEVAADYERPLEAQPLLDKLARDGDRDRTQRPLAPRSQLPTPSTHISLSLGSRHVIKPAAQRAGPDPRVGEVLQRLKMSEYTAKLAEAWVDLEELHTLGEEGLRGLGLPAQAARQLAQKLEQGEAPGRDSEMEVFVAGTGLGQFVPLLAEAWVDMAELQTMEEGELVELGLPLGAAKRLRRALSRNLRTNNSSDRPLAPGPPATRSLPAKPNAAKLEELRDQILRSRGRGVAGGGGKGCGNGGGDRQPIVRRVPIQLLVQAGDNTLKNQFREFACT